MTDADKARDEGSSAEDIVADVDTGGRAPTGIPAKILLLVPLAWQIALALWDAARGPRGRLPLGICMTIVLLSFGENVEIEAYMLWPALIVLGLHARELASDRDARFAALPACCTA